MIASIFFTVAHAVTISSAIPGVNENTTSSSPGAFVANFYQFSLIIAGVLAFGVIVYGGVLYMTSSGNPSGASEAKQWIEAALLGLLLLAGAYFILKVVNPQLVNLNLPTLTADTVQTPGVQSSTTAAPPGTTPSGTSCTQIAGTANGTCAVGQTCDTTGVGNVCHGVPSDQTACGGFIKGTCANSGQQCFQVYNNYTCTWTCTINNNGAGSCPGTQKCTKTVYGAACQ